MRQGFTVALEPVLDLALVESVGLELKEICLPLYPTAGIKGMHHHLPASSTFSCLVAVHTFNTITQEAEAVGFSELETSLAYRMSLRITQTNLS